VPGVQPPLPHVSRRARPQRPRGLSPMCEDEKIVLLHSIPRALGAHEGLSNHSGVVRLVLAMVAPAVAGTNGVTPTPSRWPIPTSTSPS
jgi:hypothetical protein